MYRRRPSFAGSFYTSDPADLRRQIETFISSASSDKKEIEGRLLGLICPHAGYIYSGQVAAHSYSYLSGIKDAVFVVIAPSHRARFDGASVIPEGIYETPIGEMSIDSEIGKILLEKDYFSYYSQIHEVEHSLEVQVPFIKFMSPDSSIVPVIVGDSDRTFTESVGSSIAEAVRESGKDAVIVISTDLSHYHSYDKAGEMDSAFINAVETFDEEKIINTIRSGRSEACGIAALLSGIAACRSLGATGIKIVNYANSGDVSGDRSQVVGYMAGVIYGK